MKNKLFKIVLLVASSLVLFSCSKPAKTADVERKEISIGFSPVLTPTFSELSFSHNLRRKATKSRLSNSPIG